MLAGLGRGNLAKIARIALAVASDTSFLSRASFSSLKNVLNDLRIRFWGWCSLMPFRFFGLIFKIETTCVFLHVLFMFLRCYANLVGWYWSFVIKFRSRLCKNCVRHTFFLCFWKKKRKKPVIVCIYYCHNEMTIYENTEWFSSYALCLFLWFIVNFNALTYAI